MEVGPVLPSTLTEERTGKMPVPCKLMPVPRKLMPVPRDRRQLPFSMIVNKMRIPR